MSRIDELVAQHCADGVPFERLRDVGTWYGGGTPSKAVAEYWENGSVPWLSPKDMDVETVAATGLSIAEVALERSPLKLVPAGSVAFVMRSNVLRRRLPIAFVPFDVTLNQDMRAVVPRPGILAEYVLQACRARADVILSTTGRTDGSMAAISSPAFLDFRIPVPPAPVQAEIVRVVRKLGGLHAELESQLAAELDLRSRQYSFYRDSLLTLPREEVRWAKLSALFDMRAGRFISASAISAVQDIGHPVPVFGGGGLRGYVAEASHEGERVLIGRQGALCGNVKRTSGEFYATEHAVVVSANPEVDIRWAFHMLRAMNLNQHASKSAQPGLAVGTIAALEVPVPELDEQRRIGTILDKFDALVNNLSIGLPAEIAARRAQYEYCRDRLLIFDEEVA